MSAYKSFEHKARKYCFLKKIDPEEQIGHGSENSDCAILLYSKRWELVAQELLELDIKLTALGILP